MNLFRRSKEIKAPKFSDEFLLKQYEASLRTQGLHEQADQILLIIAKLKAGEALAQAIEREPWEYSDDWAKVVHKAWKRFRRLEEPKNGDD